MRLTATAAARGSSSHHRRMISLAQWRRLATRHAERLFAAALRAAGYRHDRPDAGLAWRVFREFAGVRFRVADDALLFHPLAPNPRHRTTAAGLHLVRQFTHEWFRRYGHMEQLHLVLTYDGAAGLEPGTWRTLWTYEAPSPAEFFDRAEAAQEFAALVLRARPVRSTLQFETV
jgi:hypothetical protein